MGGGACDEETRNKDRERISHAEGDRRQRMKRKSETATE
jgi:hypothetical protein